ncbi:hypothetical protein PTT_17979 [Pyrenophora teres f. teres 0-1]|uniref:Uncharacterized protein n=1 Tax=Pyrenophora teres f. teres (strain 0-1) TaxID=861557 RepID=E3S5P5_PYRTT|nr:hypothetical protein PTT_17979 [Pyrenophora teres f. teres 0-1]
MAVFVRAVMKILYDHLPETAPFVDDIIVAGPRDDYRGEEAFDSAEAIVLGKKSWWGVP